MKNYMKLNLFVFMAAFIFLAGCSGSISKGQIIDAINESIKGNKTCFSIENQGMPTWPLKVRRPDSAFSAAPLDPILAAMQAAGYLKITQVTYRRGFLPQLVDVITPTDEAKGWWGVNEGFCLGTRVVEDVQEWTEPSKESGKPIEVNFTWHLDAPSWANRKEFNSIKGMRPVKGVAVLQKTNKGWKATVF